MSLQGNLSVARMCKLAGVSRAGFYRFLEEEAPVEQEMELRSLIQQIVLEHKRRYGYRRVARVLNREHGLAVNHKRVLRLMREDNLLALQPRAFVVTTDSQHGCQVYLNLAARLQLTAINQLWVADINLHSARARVCLSGPDSGRLLAQGGGLGTEPEVDFRLLSDGAAQSLG
jgi:hypothetical protein